MRVGVLCEYHRDEFSDTGAITAGCAYCRTMCPYHGGDLWACRGALVGVYCEAPVSAGTNYISDKIKPNK